jgi:hypothetical protein
MQTIFAVEANRGTGEVDIPEYHVTYSYSSHPVDRSLQDESENRACVPMTARTNVDSRAM